VCCFPWLPSRGLPATVRCWRQPAKSGAQQDTSGWERGGVCLPNASKENGSAFAFDDPRRGEATTTGRAMGTRQLPLPPAMPPTPSLSQLDAVHRPTLLQHCTPDRAGARGRGGGGGAPGEGRMDADKPRCHVHWTRGTPAPWAQSWPFACTMQRRPVSSATSSGPGQTRPGCRKHAKGKQATGNVPRRRELGLREAPPA
jgi:hypothetical protein